jgi:hypothetical protein
MILQKWCMQVCSECYSIGYRHLNLRYVQAVTNKCNRGLLSILFAIGMGGIRTLNPRTLRWGFYVSTTRGASLLTVSGDKRSNKAPRLQVFKLLTSWIKGHGYTIWAQRYKEMYICNLQLLIIFVMFDPDNLFQCNGESLNGVPFSFYILGQAHGLIHKH